jgi:hypothetical protein
MNYLFIILDRYGSSDSVTATFKSNMEPLQAFRFAYLGNVDEEGEEYFENEIYPNLKVNNSLVTFDGEEVSYILVKLK